MQKNKNIFAATRNAMNGIQELMQEKSVRRELVLAAFTIIYFCYKPNVYTALLAVLSLVLLAVEALNTAIEKTCDLITLDHHPEVKKIKDLGAAAVLIIVLTIGLIFIRYLSPFF